MEREEGSSGRKEEKGRGAKGKEKIWDEKKKRERREGEGLCLR